MSKRSGRLRSRRAGQALVEFVLVVPLLLLLLLGVYEFGRAWQIYQVITDGAREGARTAAIHDNNITQDSIRSVVNLALARASIDTTQATKTIIGWTCGTCDPGDPVTVQVSYPHNLGIVGGFLGWSSAQQGITFQTSITMRKE